MLGLRTYHVRELAGTLPGRRGRARATCSARCTSSLSNATPLVEVNPLVLLEDDRVVALDAKVTIDDNALWRHPDLAALVDQFPIADVEARAKAQGLQYVKLDGEVGIIGNGAGLVMSTLDVVAQAGARRRTSWTSAAARRPSRWRSLEVVLSDPDVSCS